MARRRGNSFLLTVSGFLAVFCCIFAFAAPTSLAAASLAAAASAADPQTSASATGAPTTGAPTTETPPTEAPTTPAPPPTTPAPPATTPEQPTVAPTNPAQTTPVEPVTPTTPQTPEITISPVVLGDSTPVWPWVLAGLGALALIGGIVWFARSSSRRTDAAAAWRTRRLNAYAEGAALHDAILSARPDDAAQWAEIQRRANDFTQRLYQLREAAPDQDGQARAEQVLASLQALRSAIDTERASGPVHGMTAEITRERLNDFRLSLYTLRDPD
jgi:type IV secretory pathway VirB10-like protein